MANERDEGLENLAEETFDEAMAREEEREASGEEPHKAPAKVIVVRDYCVRHKGASCNRCEVACPKSAISFSDDDLPVVDQELCTRCGICFGICDALSSTRITMIDLMSTSPARKTSSQGSIPRPTWSYCHAWRASPLKFGRSCSQRTSE